MKVYKVHAWPRSTSRDGRWTIIVDTAEAIEKCGEQWVMHGRNLEPPEGWFADRQEALDHAADAIEAAGHAALEQAQELRGGVTA